MIDQGVDERIAHLASFARPQPTIEAEAGDLENIRGSGRCLVAQVTIEMAQYMGTRRRQQARRSQVGARELQSPARDTVALRTRPSSSDKNTAVTMGDLVRSTLRLRPDRIIVGDAAGRTLVERPDDAKGRDWHASLAGFIAETDRVLDLLSGFMPEVRPLSDAETLTYLHGTVSRRRHPVAVPETPIYLDALLADTPLVGGLEPKLGDRHLRTLTVLGFPNLSRPGILDALNLSDFGYRWVTRFIALDKTDATKALTKIRRQWFNKRKSITALLREVMYIALQFRRYPGSQLYIFDKGYSARAAVLAMGGAHHALGLAA
jgi:hypothetical protein